ncbi:MAG: metallophosphoesterase [Kiritimatiellae bacterium]|nr:metallophosphoesterase [Kiritimatiellia bacterium]
MTTAICSRKAFLEGLFGSAVLAGCRSLPGWGERAAGESDLRLGLLADIHICSEDADFGKFGDAETFRHALMYFRDKGVDGVVIAGDMADNGMIPQLKKVADAWNDVFPGDRGLDGRHVEKLFVYGNHDLEGQNYDGYEKRFFHKASFERFQICTDPAKAWEKLFGEKFEPIWLKTVRGHQVIGAHWVKGKWEGIAGVEKWFKDHASKIDRTKPFFFIQHPHPKDTCFGPEAWGHDKGFATRALSDWPNAVSFSGHSHDPATDDRFIWQGAFTAVGIGSLRYAGTSSARSALAGSDRVKLVNEHDSWYTRQGLLLDVRGDELTFSSRDFMRDERVRDDVVVTLPSAGGAARRYPAAAEGAPVWPKGAAVSVEKGAEEWKLSFPSADGAARVFGYEIAVSGEGGPKKLYACQPSFDVARRHVPKRVELAVGAAELPANAAKVVVVPVNCLGVRGGELSS